MLDEEREGVGPKRVGGRVPIEGGSRGAKSERDVRNATSIALGQRWGVSEDVKQGVRGSGSQTSRWEGADRRRE